MAGQQEFNGVLLVDKPLGLTSHDVVDRLRRKLAMKRIGHAGTLDPIATGLLVILLGTATKISQLITNCDKTYLGEMLLGVTTDTQDAQGTIIGTKDVPELPLKDLEMAMHAFLGEQHQIPPMFSAKKINGTPLYKLARKGQQVERSPRLVNVSEFDLVTFTPPRVGFRLSCSKGTYVRTILNDVGQLLGYGAHMTKLTRTRVGTLTLENATNLDDIMAMPSEEIAKLILAVTNVV
ncbi:MAG: tRNA pseudouridine(55) synthase TruB [Puniceicoccales bacterium]|jgi:tRNA pseudouridine55 synthase|nr:tRNA pseudouridine(55) synthase TruB [Puniceicoccales bacterium]